MNRPSRPAARLVTATLGLSLLASGCSSVQTTTATSSSAATVSVINCGQTQQFPSPADKIFVNDSNMAAMLLSIGAQNQVVSATSIKQESPFLASVYGKDAVAALHDSGAPYPSLEQVVGAKPDMMLAGYNYGYSESRGLMPDMLRKNGIAPYVLSESCRRTAGEKTRGIMAAWTAVRTDLQNLGTITGHSQEAAAVIKDMDTRLTTLRQAPQATAKPKVLMFDSGDNSSVFTSGYYGGPEGIIEAAGAQSTTASLKDTWTTISWERIAHDKPDFIVFNDYSGQTMAQKIALLKANPATRDLPAVKQGRYLNIAYPAWCSSPLNIDAAENLRVALEKAKLLPASSLTPKRNISLTS